MTRRLRIRGPLAFLVRFAVVAGVLYALRDDLARAYLAVVAPPANWLLGGGGVAYVREGGQLALVYRQLGLRFAVHDIVYQNALVAVALFAATAAGWRWRLGWGALTLVALWATHVVCLYLGGHVIVWDFLWSLPPEARADLLPRVAQRFPAERDWLFSRLFGLWHTWGRSALPLLIWAAAGWPQLRAAGAVADLSGTGPDPVPGRRGTGSGPAPAGRSGRP